MSPQTCMEQTPSAQAKVKPCVLEDLQLSRFGQAVVTAVDLAKGCLHRS